MNTSEESKKQSWETASEIGQEPENAGAAQTTAEDKTADGGAGEAHSQALIDELNALGAKMAEAVDAAWRSEQRKRLEEDLRTGVTRVATSLEQHLKEFSQREEARKILDKAEGVADKVRSSKVSQEIATALTQGLRALSEQLEKLTQDLRKEDAAEHKPVDDADAANADTASDEEIPIQRG